MVLMPPVYKHEAGVHGISPPHQIPDPLELTLLTIMTVMAVSGDLASIRKDFIILTILTVQSVLIEENSIETTKERARMLVKKRTKWKEG